MKYLLDTCAVSEASKPRPDKGMAEWLRSQEEDRVFLSVLSIGELEKGLARLKHSGKRDRLLRWVREDVARRFAGRILTVGAEVARLWGRMQGEAELRGEPLPVIDSLIAATAIANGCVVVTRNVEGMERCGAEVACPWSG